MPEKKFDLSAAVYSVQQSFLNLIRGEYQKLQARFRGGVDIPGF